MNGYLTVKKILKILKKLKPYQLEVGKLLLNKLKGYQTSISMSKTTLYIKDFYGKLIRPDKL